MPNSLKEDILARVDLIDVIGERVALQKKGREFVGLCPFHDDHKPSMTVAPDKGLFKCFSCGAGGDVIKFVQLYERVPFRTALERLADRAGLSLARTPEEKALDGARDRMRGTIRWAEKQFQAQLANPQIGQAAREYAHRRGLSDDTIARFGIGLAPDGWTRLTDAAQKSRIDLQLLAQVGLTGQAESGRTYDRFRDRLIFPIRDALGRTIAFGGRTLGDDPAKYLNSPETALFNKSRTLFAFDLAREAIRNTAQVIVVEGYLDAIMLHQAGITNSVATLGTALTDAHLSLLKSQVNEIVLCFDGDAAGIKAADRGVETAVRHSISVKVLILPDDADPDDYVSQHGADAFRTAVAGATDALAFKWEQTRQRLADGDLRSRTETIETFLNFVAATTTRGELDPISFGQLVGRIGDLIGLPSAEIYRLLTQSRATIQARTTARQNQSTLDIPEGEEEHSYRDTLRGLPLALISPVEMIFGLLLEEPQLFNQLDERFDKAVSHNEIWREFFDLCCASVDTHGQVDKDAIFGHCDDNALIDLYGWSQLKDRLPIDSAERIAIFPGLMNRLTDALATVTWRDASDRLRDKPDPQHAMQIFQSQINAARGRPSGFLPLEAN
jgi:DNA primase